jgi:hypothetical protein
MEKTKNEFIRFLIDSKNAGKLVAAYGAAAKGNTLLNFAGVKSDLIAFVVDASVYKQGKFLPGSHIPIFEPTHLENCKIDILLVLPWNLINEIQKLPIISSLRNVRLVTAVPEIRFH